MLGEAWTDGMHLGILRAGTGLQIERWDHHNIKSCKSKKCKSCKSCKSKKFVNHQ